MGQIFHACAYDIETRTCCAIDADKFHANCYSFSGAVLSMHYLLRQKPYHIMWGGGYVVIDDNLKDISSTEILLGISTYEDYESFEYNNEDIQSKSYYDRVKFIDDNGKLWNRIYVWDDAERYFDWNKTHSALYCGYLINHSQKLAVDLADYHQRSKFLNKEGESMAIDAVPVLTETGGGAQMAYFDGVSYDSTEKLAGKWCGDLLQIVDELPDGYEVIDCCFADVWQRAKYCCRTFGTNKSGYILSGDDSSMYKAAPLDIFGERGLPCYIKVEETQDEIKYVPRTAMPHVLKEKTEKRNGQ